MQAIDNGVAVEGGMKYKAIIVQDRTYISPEANAKLNQLKDKGVPVIRCDKGENVAEELVRHGLQPDIDADRKIHFFHRQTQDSDIYFVYNHSDTNFEDYVRLRSIGKDVELWNPYEASRESIKTNDGFIDLSLNPYQALFIICHKK